MKNLLKAVFLMGIAAVGFAGCKKDEVQNMYLGGTPSVFSANKTNVVLTAATEKEEAIKFAWTNPNYRFSTGLSSQDVYYALEFDINTQFNSAKKYTATIAKDLTKAYTGFDFNAILANGMQLPYDIEATVYARVVSSMRFESAVNGKIESNYVTLKAKPYAPPPTVPLPDNGNLWVVGDATNMGWDNNIPAPYDVSLKFTKISNTLYEGTFNFKGGGAFKLLQDKGNWDTQYYKLDGTWDKGNFRKKNSDPAFSGPPTAGMHKMTVNFQLGTFTMVKL